MQAQLAALALSTSFFWAWADCLPAMRRREPTLAQTIVRQLLPGTPAPREDAGGRRWCVPSVCREAGALVTTHTLVRDLNVGALTFDKRWGA